MKLEPFFREHPVFTTQEFGDFLRSDGKVSKKHKESLLEYHTNAGNLLNIRRGLYAVIPKGLDPKSFAVNPFLVAAKLKGDAVLAYHTALAFFGKTYSMRNDYVYLTHRESSPLQFRSYLFKSVIFPSPLKRKQQELYSVETVRREGVSIRVTSYERTLVDMLDRINLSGGWEEVWRSLESVEYFDLDKVVEYALLFGKATTAALVGFYLEQHHGEIKNIDHYLPILEQHKPKQAHYLERDKKDQKHQFIKRWNLMIPNFVIERNWEELSQWKLSAQ